MFQVVFKAYFAKLAFFWWNNFRKYSLKNISAAELWKNKLATIGPRANKILSLERWARGRTGEKQWSDELIIMLIY